MAEAVKTDRAATLRFQAVAWKCCMRETPRVGDVIPTSGDRAIVPCVDDVEDERRVNTDGGVKG
jgi:hypothetical protein